MSIVSEPVYAEQLQDIPCRSPDPLCSKCSDLEDDIISRLTPLEPREVGVVVGFSFEVKYDFDTMEQGAANGCLCCRLIRFGAYDVLARAPGHKRLARIPLDEPGPISHDNSATANGQLKLQVYADSDQRRIPVLALLEVQHRADYDLRHTLRQDCGRGGATEPFAPNFIPNLQLVSSLVRDWLSRCNETHTACARPPASDLSSHPKRLVNTLSGAIRLIETGGEHYRYAALSYCWGRRSQQTCTKANVDRFYNEITPEDVSATVIDAIRIADSIGLQYIWIDALCIIQDDLDDWALESLKMQSIFENATLTIAASGANDSSRSLLAPRESSRYPLRPLRLAGSTLHLDKPSSQNLRVRPWRSRAWTMQEEALSRRMLYFDTDTLIWQCAEAECYEWGHDEDHTYEAIQYRATAEVIKWSTRDLGITRRCPADVELGPTRLRERGINPYHAWGLARSDYVNRFITLPSDWPVAIQGLGDIVQKMRPYDRLIWGMWKSEFVEELESWGFRRRDCSRLPQGHEGMPSWSWFSQLGHGRMRLRPLDNDRARAAAKEMHIGKLQVVASCVAITPEEKGLFPPGAEAHMRGWLIKDWLRYYRRLEEEKRETQELYAQLQRSASFLLLAVNHYEPDEFWARYLEPNAPLLIRGILIAKKGDGLDDESTPWKLVEPRVRLHMPQEELEELESEQQQDIRLV